MHTDLLDRNYYFVYTALIFLSIGLMTSPTIVAGYQIFIFYPAVVFLMLQKKKRVSKSSLMLLSLCLWGTLSIFYNFDTINNIGKSFQDLRGYFYGVFAILPIGYFFEKRIKKHFILLINLLVCTIVIAFFVGISSAWFNFNILKFEYIDHHGRSGGFFHYMRYGYGSGLLFLLGLGMLFNKDKIKEFVNIKVLIVGTVFCLAAIGTSQTRGALLGLLAGTPLLFYRYRRKLFRIMTVCGAIFISIIIYFSFFSNVTDYRFLNINDGSNSVRASQWYTAVKVAQDNPVFGLGPGQFKHNVTAYKMKYNIWGLEYAAHAHNIVLEHVANFGFVGLVFFLMFFVFWFLEMYSLNSDFGWVVCSYIVAFFVSGQVELIFDALNSSLLFFIYSMSQYFYLKKTDQVVA